MRKRFLFAIVLMVCLLGLSGCSCDHTWTEADCLNPKTCLNCQKTEGEPLGHTPGEWTENIDIVTGAGTRERYCAVCNESTASEAVSLSTLIRDDLFLFTPREFMERLTLIAKQHSGEFTYEFVSNGPGLQVLAYANGKQSIIQFFHSDTTALADHEIDVSGVWCVSLIAIGESDADLRLHFFMACDPTLDKDAAFITDMDQSAAFITAAGNGEAFGYYQQNHLLYESSYIAEGALGQDYSMNIVNIYASDFR